jgi:hypothetical protein
MEYDITTIVANILIGLGLGIGLVVLWVWNTIRRFENDLRSVVRETIQEVEEQFIGVVVEEDDDGQLFFYREEDRQFMCQGSTLAEVRKKFNELFPEKIAYLAGGDPALVERLKAELKTIKEKEVNENSISI